MRLKFCFDFIPESNLFRKQKMHGPGFLLCNTVNKLILHEFPEICTIYFRETTLQSESVKWKGKEIKK